jgi:glycosyltransferase involved in cell wall biosynthesis
MPVWNGQKYLNFAIESVLSQEGVSLQLILVDDGSTDLTLNICHKWEDEDPRVRCVRLDPNGGLPAALNAGFFRASGKAWTWTSCDNCYKPGALDIMYRILQEKDVDVVYARVTDISESNRVLRENPAVNPNPAALTKQNAVHACFLHRPSVYHLLGGYDTTLYGGEDWDFWVRAYLKGCTFAFIGRPLYYYRVHDDSMTTRDRKKCLRAWARVIWKNKLYSVYPNALAMWAKSFLM